MRLQLKRRLNAAEVPPDGELAEGELAVNPTDGVLWVGGVGETGAGALSPVLLGGNPPTTSLHTTSFTIDPADGMDHHYRVSTGAVGVVITIPDTLPIGYRFQVSVQADTTFA